MSAIDQAPQRKILVIEDNEEALEAISELLKMDGFSTVTATNGALGLRKMKADDHIFIVLLDLWMPIMDGWEFLQERKRDKRLAKIPVVVLSAIPSKAIDGAEAVLTKPVNIDYLLQILRRYAARERSA
jgi:CheY-like chemotaxis protein